MAKWLNHVAIAAPRNATTTHTVNPASGTVITGTNFTPTVGRFLLCVVNGAVTSTTPSGWTLPTNGSAVLNVGLYVFTKTAAGSDTLATTHNASDYPAVFDFYEFPTGSTFVASASSTGVTNATAGAPLSGLTGTNLIFGASGQADSSSGGAAASVTWDTGVVSLDYNEDKTTTDGTVTGVVYLEDSVLTSKTFTATSTATGNQERLTFAVHVSQSATTAAVTAALTFGAPAPAVTGVRNGTVVAVTAVVTLAAPIPSVSGETVISGGGPAAITFTARAPVVTGGAAGDVTVVAVRATLTVTTRPPTVSTPTAPVDVTAGQRILTVTAESRVTTVAAELRTITVPQEA